MRGKWEPSTTWGKELAQINPSPDKSGDLPKTEMLTNLVEFHKQAYTKQQTV
jgi:hypothetical protein